MLKKYIAFSKMGLVPEIVCNDEPRHGALTCGMTVDEKAYLYCLYCNYRIYLGYNSLNEMAKDLYRAELKEQLRSQIM